MGTAIVNSDPALSSERWVHLESHGVMVSDLGRVRTITRLGPTCYGATRLLKGRMLRTEPGARGYVRINCGQGIGVQFVHRLVAMAFIPNPQGLPVINHLNGNKADNRPENLEWCTQAHNARHAFETGLSPKRCLGKGNNSPASKLREAQVLEIKKALRDGARNIDLARRYSVNKSTIAEIKAGRSWGHVTCT